MKKKNIWVLTVFFGFVVCFIISAAVCKDKLEEVTEIYVDDACTCFAESVNVLFEYYKSSVDYIRISNFEKLRRNELSQITASDVTQVYELLRLHAGDGDTILGAIAETVDGTFVSTENEYATKEVLFDEEQLKILSDFKNEIEQKNTFALSDSFIYKKHKSCFAGMPIFNNYDEIIGYKAVICDLSKIEAFENEYKDGTIIPEVRLQSETKDFYSSSKFYQTMDKRDAVSKSTFLPIQGLYLTVCVDGYDVLKLFYISRGLALIIWGFLILYLCREIFTKTLTVNRRFAYISGVILISIIGILTYIFNYVMIDVQNESNYMQATLCTYRDQIRLGTYKEVFHKLQKDINNKTSNLAIEGSMSEYIASNYGELFEKFIDGDKYGGYVFLIDRNGHKVSYNSGTEINIPINPNWFNYNKFSYNAYFYEMVELEDVKAKYVVLTLPIAKVNDIASVICLVYNLEEYASDLNSFLLNTSNEKIIVGEDGEAFSLKENSNVEITHLNAKGNKPYLSTSWIGKTKLIRMFDYKIEKKKGKYYIFDSFYLQKRIVFLRDNNGRSKTEVIILLFVLGVLAFFGSWTHLINRNAIWASKVKDDTKLTIQEKLKTFK